ncbi:MAG: hypothetical protein EXS17_07175 [Phycisphaerales bacterium]|nr:hypothetical protein [Phycisphaerales bacterium]
MDEPKNSDSQGDSDPFSELPNDPSFDGIIEETTAPEESISADASGDGSVGYQRTAPPSRKPSRLLPRLAAALAVVLVGVVGWLGWSYWCDRESLGLLDADLIAARDGAEQSKGRTVDSGERAAARALVARVNEILNAPWWDRVAVRIIDQERLASAQSQTDELLLTADHRELNRAWWGQRTAAVDAAIAADDRTIPGIQNASDDLESAQPPHSGEGGFSADDLASLTERCSSDLDQLMAGQNAQLELRQSQLAVIRASATLDELAAALAAVDQPTPLDRNPPEIAEAIAAIRAQAVIVGDFLSARDAMESELTATLAEVAALDLDTGSAETLQLVATRLGSLATPDDARFDRVRDLASRGATAAIGVRETLQARDVALAWFESRRHTLEAITTVEDLATFTQELLSAEPPPSDLPIVARTAEDFLARLSARTIVLADERRLMDESRARAEAFTAALLSVNAAVESGAIAQAADALATAAPEGPEQIEAWRLLKDGFARVAVARFNAMAQDARSTGSWRALANSLRGWLASAWAPVLAADLANETIALWALASIEEDKMLYEDLQRLSNGSFEEYALAARWYLDPIRMLGATPPMQAQVAKSLEALELPGLTVQIEGVEWSDAQCEWSTPRTSLTVAINEIPFGFDLPGVTADETTLLGSEVALQAHRDERVEFGVSGYFDCADDDGVFAGSGGLTMDELRCGGRFALPFWNDGDQTLTPHKLLLISIPDEEVRLAMSLINWIDPRVLVKVEGVPLEVPAAEEPLEVPVEEPAVEPTAAQ